MGTAKTATAGVSVTSCRPPSVLHAILHSRRLRPTPPQWVAAFGIGASREPNGRGRGQVAAYGTGGGLGQGVVVRPMYCSCPVVP